MPITTTEHPSADDTHSRFVLVFPDAPTIVNIHGLIQYHAHENLIAIVMFAADGSSEQVTVEAAGERLWGEGLWYVHGTTGNQELLEQIEYDVHGHVTFHRLFVDSFTLDEVPVFAAGAGR